MTVVVKNKAPLVVPSAIQRQAGLKSGDRAKFDVTAGIVTITPVSQPTYKLTKAELAAIRKSDAAIARGEVVSLTDFLHDLDRPRRKTGAKPAQKQRARFPAKDEVRIFLDVTRMPENPFAGDVRKLEGEGDRWRRRIGNNRSFFSVEPTNQIVSASAIMGRTTTTY